MYMLSVSYNIKVNLIFICIVYLTEFNLSLYYEIFKEKIITFTLLRLTDSHHDDHEHKGKIAAMKYRQINFL